MATDPRQELAEFLKIRRTRVRPEDLGLESGPRRRVAGLRREELALLAGVSTAASMPARQPRYGPEAVPDSTLLLMRTMSAPALVIGRFLDILAWNPLAGALLGGFAGLPESERNLLLLFLDPRFDQTCPDRKATVAELTAFLRVQVAVEPGHPRAEEIISRLTNSSAEFAELWGRHDVGEATRGRMRVIHPLVGELSLDWDAYPMPGAPSPVLFVCTAPQGGPDSERLQRLALAIGEPDPVGSRSEA